MRGECLRCALRLVLDEEADEELIEGAAVPTSLHYGHFEVVQDANGLPVELGSGAMGVTYRAQDTVLRAPVALKVLRQNVASDPAARARFLREARATARLHHPHVASVTFYGEQAGECFYAMELIEGETLAERVRRAGPLSAEQALEAGVQVARALAAAEALGVVHRDLKPANLMLVGPPPTAPGTVDSARRPPASPPLHVKVIDWGLAKAVQGADAFLAADHTREAFVGTPAFASPEQFARAAASRRVDTRSDIYSLGVTLWFLLCGRAPFVGDTLEAIHARQRVLPAEQLKAAQVPGHLAKVLRSMVAFDPAARPQSARELLDLLARSQSLRGGGKTWMTSRRALTWRLIVAVVLMVAVATGARWWQLQHGRDTPPAAVADKASVAVLPFENLGSNEADAFFTTGVQDEITNDLAYIAALRVIGADSTRSYLPGRRDLSRIGAGLKVRYLLEGSVRREDDKINVNVRLVDLREPTRQWSESYTRQVGEVFAVQGEITRAVAEYLHATLTDAEKAVINQPPTTSLAAYDLYLRVHGRMPLMQSYQERDRYFRETVVPTLEAAVALDPNFAFAYCDLADAYDTLAAYEGQRMQAEAAAKHHAQAESALAKARMLRPNSGQVHLAQASHIIDFVRDNELARRELELARRALPNNAAVENAMGHLAHAQGRWDEAVACYERALQLEPRNHNRRWDLAALYRALRRYEEADRELGRIIDSMPTSESTVYRFNLAISKVESHGDLTPYRQALDTATPVNESSRDATNRGRMTLAVLSHDSKAISKLLVANQTELLYNLLPAPKAWFEALAARMRHDEAAAQTAFQTARVEVERALQLNPTSGVTLGLLAMIDAGLGRGEEAVREATHACEVSSAEEAADEAPLTACNLAVVYAWTGQSDRACETLEPWITRPAGLTWPMQPTYGDFRLNPVWDPLRGNPSFEELVARLTPPQAH